MWFVVLDLDKINSFIDELRPFPEMWNSLSIVTAAYKRKADEEWNCLSFVLHISEKDLESEMDAPDVPYKIPDRLVIIRQHEKFSIESLRDILGYMTSGYLKLGKFNLIMTGFETIDHIKQRRPGWQREGLTDTEGWPALILRNYRKNKLLTISEWREIDKLVKKHTSEPHDSLAEVTLKYLGIEVGGGRSGAIYGVAPFYLKLEGVRFERNGNLAVTVVSHKCIKPSDLQLNVVLYGASSKIESRGLKLAERPKKKGNFWMIRKLVTSEMDAVEARLYLIHRDNIVFEDWAHREDKEKKIKEESEIKRRLPQTEDELRDKIVIPLFRKMRFQRVNARMYHGPGERGGDILPFYKINEFGVREYYAAQIKAEKLRGGAEGGPKGNVMDALRQYDSAMTTEWKDTKEGIEYYLDHFILVALHGATPDAEKQLFDHPTRRGNRHLIYLTGRDLIELIEKYGLQTEE